MKTTLPTPGETCPSENNEQPPQTEPVMEATTVKLAGQARDDLAKRIGVPIGQIIVSTAEAVTWPDSSLGCPQPGMAYAQVLTPGYIILLEAGGRVYEYHAGRNSDAFYCENPEPPVPGMPGDV